MNCETVEEALSGILRDLLRYYDERVPERSTFPDVRVGRSVYFGDPDLTRPGRVELVVMHMDKDLDAAFDHMRFVSVRVMKSREGGFVSSSCLHGTKKELRERLTALAGNPQFLVERVYELANGLPEETNPDIWR